ncbi:MAG: hypothetical protein KC457_09745, partial [Myxococcales bacterium]|nr:hypothetical protein [Myxococcales bacterium]
MAKKIAAVLLVLVLIAAGVIFVLWHRLTALPEWYGSTEMIAEDGTPQVDGDWVLVPHAERPEQAPADAEVYQIRNPHLRTNKAAPIKPAIKASRATYSGGTLEGGAVLNLGDMKVEELPEKDREAYQKLID